MFIRRHVSLKMAPMNMRLISGALTYGARPSGRSSLKIVKLRPMSCESASLFEEQHMCVSILVCFSYMVIVIGASVYLKRWSACAH